MLTISRSSANGVKPGQIGDTLTKFRKLHFYGRRGGGRDRNIRKIKETKYQPQLAAYTHTAALEKPVMRIQSWSFPTHFHGA